MLKLFRLVAFVEGISTLLLFLVAMPLKYGFGNDVLIRPFGMFHGFAFVAYLAVMVVTFLALRVGPTGWLRSFVASLFPFGTFLNDGWVQRELGRDRSAERTA